MNNTKTLAIAAILMAATLVVGGILAGTTATSALAYQKKRGHDDSKNGNTVTIQKCKQKGSVSGFDNTAEQECGNTICTHPGENATCVSENEQAVVTPPVTPPEECARVAPDSTFDVTLQGTLENSVTLRSGDELCAIQLGNHVVVDITADPDITTRAIITPAGGPNHDQCSSPFVRALVSSGTPPNPLEIGGFACVGLAGNV